MANDWVAGWDFVRGGANGDGAIANGDQRVLSDCFRRPMR